MPGFEVIAWWRPLAPAKTPRPIVEGLNRELPDALERGDSLLDQGMEPTGGTPEQLAALSGLTWKSEATSAGAPA